MVNRACFSAIQKLCSILKAESLVVVCTVLVEYDSLRAEGGYSAVVPTELSWRIQNVLSPC